MVWLRGVWWSWCERAKFNRCYMLSFNQLGRLGRLGNQMFQYAALFAISKKCGADFCIPESKFLDEFSDHQLKKVFKLSSVKYYGHQADVPQITEGSFSYDSYIHLNCRKNADLVGFFQTEKYFTDIAAEITSEFAFNDEIDFYAKTYMANFKSPIISLHVRRGDYLKQPESFPVCRISYYQKALSLFPKKYPVIVFSDDIDWCRSQKIFTDKRFIFSLDQPNSYDLCMMSYCSHHIIANSSFSWWGAWLGHNPEKKIIAPRIWFGRSGHTANYDTSDLIPSRWIRI